MLAFGNVQSFFRFNQVIGHEINVAAHLGRQAVFAVMVAHHEHLVGRNACARQAIFVVAGHGFHGIAGLVIGGEFEIVGVKARPANALMHGRKWEHGHGGHSHTIALPFERRHGACGLGVCLHTFSHLGKLSLVETREQRFHLFGVKTGRLRERFPEHVVVGGASVRFCHGLHARHHRAQAHVGVEPVFRSERAERLEVALHEHVGVHGQKRAVEVEKNGGV